jgi:hypothetical protein
VAVRSSKSERKRRYQPIDANWPYPPPGRPRFAHHRLTEYQHGTGGVTFRTYADGYVVAYGRASDRDDVPVENRRPDDWVAIVWTAHPLLTPGTAEISRYLADRATFQDAVAAVDKWELEG